MSRLVDWLDERMAIRAIGRSLAGPEIEGGARVRYVLGAVAVYLFVQQCVLGTVLALGYAPTATDAWASTAHIQDQANHGWFVRGMHDHGTAALVIVTLLHVVRVVASGAYQKPREVVWWTGLVLGGLVVGFALTGYFLPYDQKGYWRIVAELGYADVVPGGESVRVLAQGGHTLGNLSLLRFYTLHALVLPLLFALVMVAHIALVRRHGVVPPPLPAAELAARRQRYAPAQLVLDVVAMAVVATVLVVVTVRTHGAELWGPADPTSNFPARPEWYLLPLYRLVRMFEGPLQVIPIAIVPGAAAAILFALPFVARGRARRPVLGLLALGMAGAVALGALQAKDDGDDEDHQKLLAEARVQADAARKWATEGVLPEGGTAVFLNDPQAKVRMLFRDECQSCHELDGQGGGEAPRLTDYASRAWLAGLVRNPRAPEYFGNTKHDTMEPYGPDALSDEALAAVVEHLVSLMGEEEFDAGLAAKGKTLFEDELDCTTCHEVEPGKAGEGPNLSGHGSVEWVVRVLADTSKPDLFGEKAAMPEFAGKLSEDEILQMAEFVVSQRARPEP